MVGSWNEFFTIICPSSLILKGVTEPEEIENPAALISTLPLKLEIKADGSPGVSDSIEMEPDCKYIDSNGLSIEPNVAP